MHFLVTPAQRSAKFLPPVLHLIGTTFVARCAFEERDTLRRHGFRWDKAKRYWYTSDPGVAHKLREFASPNAGEALDALRIRVTQHWPQPLPKPAGGIRMLPHQVDALRFALERDRGYLALDPGLGKTGVAAMLVKALVPEHAGQAVYVCPPYLVENVIAEFERWWGVTELIGLLDRSSFGYPPTVVLPDSLLEDWIVQLDLIDLTKRKGALLIVDEAHRFKNPSAKRTQALFGGKGSPGIRGLFSRRIYMSGTPMPNRPVELFPILSAEAPETIDYGNLFSYGRKYCGAFKGPFGWDFSGASNVKELARRVVAPSGPFMLRIRKDVLSLPPKVEELFVVTGGMSQGLRRMDRDIGEALGTADDSEILTRLQKLEHRDSLPTATYRRLLGMEKAKAVLPYLDALREEYSGEPFLVYAHHHEVVAYLAKELECRHVVSGLTPTKDRKRIVDEFQTSKELPLMVASYGTMVGYAITRATRVVFVEFGWVPGDNDQAADRPHRIGQTKTVFVQYVVYRNSIDKRVIETLLRKRKSIQHF